MKRSVAGLLSNITIFLPISFFFGIFVSDLKSRSDPIFNCISTLMASNEALRAGWVAMAVVRGNDNGSGAINKFGGGGALLVH